MLTLLLGQLLPILVGTKIPDPTGTDEDVPILGIDKNKFSGSIRPLAGTMEDPKGRGLIPIVIGVEGIDTGSGETENQNDRCAYNIHSIIIKNLRTLLLYCLSLVT